MKKIILFWLLLFSFLFLGWASALNFVIQNDSNSWKNTVLDYNMFASYSYSTDREITLNIWSKNWYISTFGYNDMPFSWSTFPIDVYQSASSSTNIQSNWTSFRTTFNNYSTYSIINTWIIKTWSLASYAIPSFYVGNYWADLWKFAVVWTYDSWVFSVINYPWYVYTLNDSQRVGYSFWWFSIDNLEKASILDFTSYRFFRQDDDLLSGWEQNDYITTPFRADYFQKFLYDRTSYVYRYNNLTYDRNFYDSWKKGLTWLWYWNSYSFVSDLWDSSDNLMSFDEFYLWGRSDIVMTPSYINSLNSFSGWRFEHIAILNPFWFEQDNSDLISPTVILWKSRDYPNRLRVDVVDCSATTIEKINDSLICPLIKRWYLKADWVYTNSIKWQDISLYNTSDYDILPFDNVLWSYDFAGQFSFLNFLGWAYSNSHLSDFYLDWTKIGFKVYNNSTISYEFRFTIVEDAYLTTTLWEQAQQGVLWAFVPLFSWGVAQTGQYVLPWQPWFTISWWVTIIDSNWTWWILSGSLTWWLKLFLCPVTSDFLVYKLSSLPLMSYFENTAVDFNLLAPISCLYWSYVQWKNAMVTTSFFTDTWTNLILERSENYFNADSTKAKNLFYLIINFILWIPAVYLFIKFLK